jgi:hypothetical protein
MMSVVDIAVLEVKGAVHVLVVHALAVVMELLLVLAIDRAQDHVTTDAELDVHITALVVVIAALVIVTMHV